MPAMSIATRLQYLTVMLFLILSLPMSNAWSNPELVADIATVPEPRTLYPGNLVEINGLMVFAVTTEATGRELWVTDGAENRLLKDIQPGAGGSIPVGFSNTSVVGNTLYFTAFQEATGIELWKTDGSTAGTELVIDLLPGAESGLDSFPDFVALDNELYFIAQDVSGNKQLWKTNGTAGGTTQLTDIQSDAVFNAFLFRSSDFPVVVANHLFFLVVDSSNSNEVGLWKTNGTPGGTEHVTSVLPAGRKGLFAVVNDEMYFLAKDGSTGSREYGLWKSDGTASGTQLLKGSTAYDPNSSIDNDDFSVVNDEVFFRAHDVAYDVDIWKTDGTVQGTQLVKDIQDNVDGGDSYPENLHVLNDHLLFTAANKIWKTDGTELGTVVLGEFVSNNGRPVSIVAIGSTEESIYYRAVNAGNLSGLWKSNGTVSGTVFVKEIDPDIFSDSVVLNSELYFSEHDSNQGSSNIKIWKTDGTDAGTVLLAAYADNYPVDSIGFQGARLFTAYAGKVYFAFDFDFCGDPGNGFCPAVDTSFSELWVTDGTVPGTQSVSIETDNGSSNPGQLFEVDNKVIFVASDNTGGSELWVNNGSATWQLADINPGSAGSRIHMLGVYGSYGYFLADNGINIRLWRTDGTVTGTILLGGYFSYNLYNGLYEGSGVFAAGNKLVFSASDGVNRSDELWVTDGTATGTHELKDIYPGADTSKPSDLTLFNGEVYFAADDGVNGRELWKTDGTEAGTVLAINVRSGRFDSNPRNLTVLGGSLFFTATKYIPATSSFQHELWKTDGTSAGLTLVQTIDDLNDNTAPVLLRNFIMQEAAFVHGTNLYFITDVAKVPRLWKTNGTEAGTQLLATFNLGNFFRNNYKFLGVVDEKVILKVNDEVWLSDGTIAGTLLVTNTADTANLLQEKLYFVKNDGVSGEELWVSDLVPSATGRQIADILPGSGASAPIVLSAINDILYFSANDGVTGRELWTFSPSPTPRGSGIMGDFVWEDQNGNGVLDSNESGLANVSVDLLTCTGTVVGSLTTSASGSFRFTQIAAGDYQMRYHLPANYRFSPVNQGGDYRNDSNADTQTGLTPCLPMTDGQQRLAIDAGMVLNVTNAGTGVMGDFVWNDLNGNGVFDASESGFANVPVDLLTCTGAIVDSLTTGADGSFRFTQIDVGDYQMQYHLPANYRFSSANQGGDYRNDSNAGALGLTPCLPMADGQQRLAIDAGMVLDVTNTGTGTMGDFVWNDLNANGIHDSNEPGLANVSVDLLSCSGSVVDTVTTSADGSFLFTKIAVGDYQMQFHLPAGYSFSPEKQGSDYRLDSNVNTATGLSPCLPIDGHQRTAVDAGMVREAVSDPLVLQTLLKNQPTNKPGPTVAVNEALEWSYSVTNNGNGALENVVVTGRQKLPTLGSWQTLCNLGTLQQGETGTCTRTDSAVAGTYKMLISARGNSASGENISIWKDAFYKGQ